MEGTGFRRGGLGWSAEDAMTEVPKAPREGGYEEGMYVPLRTGVWRKGLGRGPPQKIFQLLVSN